MKFFVHDKIPDHLTYAIDNLIDQMGDGRFKFWPNVTNISKRDYYLIVIKDKKETDWDIVVEYQGKLTVFLRTTYLKWDSEHFGYNCYKIQIILVASEIDLQIYNRKIIPIIKKKFHEFLCLKNVRFVFADIDSKSKLQNIIMHELGFRFVVTWIDGLIKPTIKSIKYNKNELVFGLLEENETEYFSNIAKFSYFNGGRFFLDSHFEDNKVREMYSSLVLNSFKNEIPLVLRINKRPIGLFIVNRIHEYSSFDYLKVAHLRYLIIDPKFRNQGLGECLFDYTISYLSDKCDLIVTGLEINNFESFNLHVRLGFKFNYAHNAYHYWNQIDNH